ncbi:MAG: hypothetical protein Q9170_000770 [Blastenia crenularia]
MFDPPTLHQLDWPHAADVCAACHQRGFPDAALRLLKLAVEADLQIAPHCPCGDRLLVFGELVRSSVRPLAKVPKRHITARERLTGRVPPIGLHLASWKQSDKEEAVHTYLENFSPQFWWWHRQFARLRNGRKVHIPLQTSLRSRLLKRSKDHISRLLEQLSSTVDPQRRERLRESVLLLALQHDHEKALIIMNAAIHEPTDRVGATIYVVEDAMEYLVSAHVDGKGMSRDMIENLHQLFCDFAHATNLAKRARSTSQKITFLLVRHSTARQVEVLYKTLINTGFTLSPFTLGHFTRRFTGMKRPDLAMDALGRMIASGADPLFEHVQHLCVRILKMRLDEVDRYRIQSHLATEMLERGIRPDVGMLNAMIYNAVEARDYETAHAVFESARVHGIRRNTITYSAMLKVARENMDAKLIETITQMAEKDGALPRNNPLVSCLVDALFAIISAEWKGADTRASGYRNMLQVYARYCDIGPLQDLGINLDVNGGAQATDLVSKPSSKILSVMVHGYIRLVGQPYQIRELYHRYQRCIAQNHPIIAPTAETLPLAHAFLFALGGHRHTYTTCAVILKDMLEPPPSTTVSVAKPDVHTWSLVVRSYFFNSQRAAGEKIVQLMRERGIEPNYITMNTVISAYAHMQDVSAAVHAMQQMEEAGSEAGSYTFKALSAIRDRNKLLDALRKVAETTTKGQEDLQPTDDLN